MSHETQKHKLQEEYGLAKDVYDSLTPFRQSLEQTWQDCSELTLPYVFPHESNVETNNLPTPHNSIGPAAVNNLASKLLLALMPPTGNFFRLLPNEEDVEGLDKAQLDQLDKELSKLEQDVNTLINLQALRVPLFEALKLLIITGNALVYKIPDRGLKVFSPYQYVVQRDFTGDVTSIVIEEKVSKRTLPKSVREVLETHHTEALKPPEEKDNVSVFTFIGLEGPNKFQTFQEIEGYLVPGTERTYTAETLPYLPLRWTSMANENYGRGLCEQYLGDLRSLEGISQMIIESGGIMAKTIFGLKPASSTKIEDLNNASNGDVILGDLEKDMTTLQTNKTLELQIPYKLLGDLENRVSRAFLMISGQIRDSERTTAFEVRQVANELETTLGGTFSVLSLDLQLPLLRLILNEIEPKILKVTTPAISTGISAISRERDFQNLNTMAQTVAQFGPDAIATYLNMPKYLSKIAASLGMDPEDIVKSQEQVEAEQRARLQAESAVSQQTNQNELEQIEAKKE